MILRTLNYGNYDIFLIMGNDPKDPKLWELWYIPYYGSCRILSINRIDNAKLSLPKPTFLWGPRN